MTIDRRRDGDLAVTDRSIELRRRKREIVHIIHHTTWIMETLGVVIGFVFRFVGRSEIYPNIFANLIFIQNLVSAEILVPFTHLFNEHRIKVMVLERGWIFAIKNALKFSIVHRVAPESNLTARNPENNGRHSKKINVSMEILRKYPKQECVPVTGSIAEGSTRNAPESNLTARNPENNGRHSKKINVSMEILRKYPKQECVHVTGSIPEASTKKKIANGLDIIKKHETDLPNQV